MASQFIRFPSPSGQTFDTGAGVTTVNTLRTVIVTDQTSIPVTLAGSALDFGASSAGIRVAALLGNASGIADFGSGAAGAQTLRAVISTRSEAAATPLSARLSDGAAFYNAPTTAQIPATLGQKAMTASLAVVIASDQSAINIGNISGTITLPTGAATETTLAAMSAKLPATLGQKAMTASMAVVIASDQSIISIKETDGTNNIGTFGNVTAAQYTSTPGRSMPVTAVSQGWDGTTHREIAVDASGNTNVVTASATVAFTKKGKIVAASLTTSYATVLSITTTSYIVYIFNSLNQTVLVSLDGGTTDSLELDPGESCSMDLRTNGLRFVATTNIQAKYSGTAPTSGSIRISAIG